MCVVGQRWNPGRGRRGTVRGGELVVAARGAPGFVGVLGGFPAGGDPACGLEALQDGVDGAGAEPGGAHDLQPEHLVLGVEQGAEDGLGGDGHSWGFHTATVISYSI